MSTPFDAGVLAGDAFVAREVEDALAPLVELLDAGELDWIREQLVQQLVEDESLTRALDAAYPRQADESGERVKAWLDTTLRGGVPWQAAGGDE